MTISLQKLKKVLADKGYLIRKCFILDHICRYIEVFCIQTADCFFIKIPSKYNMKPEGNFTFYKLKEMQSVLDLSPEEYGKEPDSLDMEKEYDEIEIDESHLPGEENLKEKMESKYKRSLHLKNIRTQEIKSLKDICRQTFRLQFCTQNIPYQISVIYKSYLTVGSNAEDVQSVECYYIKKYTTLDSKRFFVLIDIRDFFDKIDTVAGDIQTIRVGIYKVLDRNQTNHVSLLQKLLTQNMDYEAISYYLQDKKKEYIHYLSQFREMLTRLNLSEKGIVQKIMKTGRNHTTGSNYQNLHQDIQSSHISQQYQQELDHILTIKQEVIQNLLDVQSKLDNLALHTDKVMFDTNIMLDTIIQNFKKLNEI